jgi:hypothetical protein
VKGGRKKGERLPTALGSELADEADRQAKYWTAVGTIGRALKQLTQTEQLRVLRVLLKELEP